MDMSEDRALSHLQALCNRSPHRAVGSAGNRAASTYVTRTLEQLGYHVHLGTFECLDWSSDGARLSGHGSPRAIFPSPYGLPVQVEAPLVVASTLEELETQSAKGKILLVRGDLAVEPLAPLNYPFYNPEHHQKINQALIRTEAAALLTATSWNAELPGGQYPCPLIEDGDFPIPTAYLTAEEGDRLAGLAGQIYSLTIRSRRLPSRGSNVMVRTRQEGAPRVLLTAHLDSKLGTPGALDNASGVAVLLLMAEFLSRAPHLPSVEFLFLNGEDHYSAAGQKHYVEQSENPLSGVTLAINVDGIGLQDDYPVWSLYPTKGDHLETVKQYLESQPGVKPGPSWIQGDHSLFTQRDIPALAWTTANQERLVKQLMHTPEDTVGKVDPAQILLVAHILTNLCLTL